MRGTISRGLLRWKLEMHMTFEKRFKQKCNVLPYPEFSLNEKRRQRPASCF